MWNNFKQWWNQPFSGNSVWTWFWGILLVMIIIIFWSRVLGYLSRVEV